MLKKNLKNISYQSAAQLIPKAMMFFFIMYLARTLGSVEYGKYEFALSLGYILGIFFELGGNMILTKHVARDYYSSIHYAVKIRVTSIVAALILFFAAIFLFGLYEDIRFYIVYASAGVALSSMMNLYFAFFRGVQLMKYEAVVLIIQKGIFILLALILMFYTDTALSPLLSFMISMLAGLIIIFIIFKKRETQYLKQDTQYNIRFRDYVKDVFTLALVEIFASIYFRINQIFLEYYGGFNEVSSYAVAYRIVEVFTNIPGILLIVLFPSFARLAENNLTEFRLQFNKILVYLLGLGIFSAGICWFGGEYFFKLLGNDYSTAHVTLRYLCFPMIFLFPNYLITQGLIALNKNIKFAVILMGALLLNVVISLLIVPSYGAAGSAISIGICEAMIFAIGLYYVKKFSNR